MEITNRRNEEPGTSKCPHVFRNFGLVVQRGDRVHRIPERCYDLQGHKRRDSGKTGEEAVTRSKVRENKNTPLRGSNEWGCITWMGS